jgi:Asp-tRNA(Asn)/Glu-tRNA(Gln) amidotransferase A subunit family amidase
MRTPYRAVVAVALVFIAGWAVGTETGESPISREILASAEAVIGLVFTPVERDSMIDEVTDRLADYEKIRAVPLPNSAQPALQFSTMQVGTTPGVGEAAFTNAPAATPDSSGRIEDLAFCSIGELSELLRTRKITSTGLTRMYLERLRRFGPRLECVVTLTEDLALEQARRADEEIAAGKYRGPLHGIPYGAKDLFAVRGYPTTWGAAPFKDQVIDEDATVVRKLEEAGAVLVAKLTLGALAWGDVWYGGTTRNPWNPEQGSSGSSAGSASATAAGLVAFAIGTETWGSIVSPCTRCGATGLRPTYGRVSRTGAMALSWSMDKIGPICRSAKDCAIVLDAIRGSDGIDRTAVDRPFTYNSAIDLKRLKIGYVESLFEEDYPQRGTDAAVLAVLRELGATLVPITLPAYPVEALSFILSAEAAAAFDDLTRSGRDDLMVRQIKNAWPNVLRAARFIPAVEYLQANRVRYLVMEEMERLGVDLYVAPSFGGDNLLLTNLTGHPCVVVPNGFDDEGNPVSISFIGRLYDEGTLCAVAQAYQDATGFDEMHPPLFPAKND